MGVTSDRSDPRLTHGVDTEPRPQAEVYLVLSDDERGKGFVRPYRDCYQHVGAPGPKGETFPLTPDQRELYGDLYVRWEPYPPSRTSSATGRFWKQEQLDAVGKGCGGVTTMGSALSETYAREPHFYGGTYCAGCRMHRPVDEFVWDADGERVGS